MAEEFNASKGRWMGTGISLDRDECEQLYSFLKYQFISLETHPLVAQIFRRLRKELEDDK